MKCVVSGGNIKILAKAIHMIAKIGDEMYVMPQEECISFRSVNSANSAYIDITFGENFFSYYAFEDMEDDDALKCKILIRSAMAVFKTPNLLDKQLESCHINLEVNAEKLCFILKYKNSITKTHLLPILDCQTLNAKYKKDGSSNHLSIQPRVMGDAIQNFQQNLVEITLEVLQEKILIRNYIDENSNVSNETRTQLVFGVGEFDEYSIDSDTTITFCMKEFRAIASFAESVSQPLNVYFDNPGRPIVIVIKNTAFETNLVLATLNPDVDSQSQSTASIRPNPVPKKAAVKRNYSKRGASLLSKKLLSDKNNSKKVAANNRDKQNEVNISKDNQNNINCDMEIDENEEIVDKNLASNTSNDNSSNLNHSLTCNGGNDNNLSDVGKRKSIQHDDDVDDDDLVQNSPPRNPSKKARTIFKKCFQTTFDPKMLPGHMDIEVEDSDEDMTD